MINNLNVRRVVLKRGHVNLNYLFFNIHLHRQHGRWLESMFTPPPGIRTQTTWCSHSMSLDTGEVKCLSWRTSTYRYPSCKSGKYSFFPHRLPQSMVKDSERSELSRITFVFETTCTADCKFAFLAVRGNVPTHIKRGTANHHNEVCIYEVGVFLRRVLTGGVMMRWSSGKAATVNSHTPTSSRATAPSASPGSFNERRNLTR